jgi:hypothetical protein
MRLIDHFGDNSDKKGPCGICDRCRPPKIAKNSISRVSKADQDGQLKMMVALIPFQSKTSGQVYKEYFEPKGWDRRRFEENIWDLEAQGFVFQANQSFKKNGETIEYKRVGLTNEGRVFLHQKKLAPSISSQRFAIDERLITSRRKSANKTRSAMKSKQNSRSY